MVAKHSFRTLCSKHKDIYLLHRTTELDFLKHLRQNNLRRQRSKHRVISDSVVYTRISEISLRTQLQIGTTYTRTSEISVAENSLIKTVLVNTRI